MTQKTIRIGTRKSPLALTQANITASYFVQRNMPFEIVPIVTSGDRLKNKNLADFGGKYLFTKEIEEALLTHQIDIGVHSMKDVETWLHDDLTIPCILSREDARDAFISRDGTFFQNLKHGAILGTSSIRRAAQALSQRPDLHVVPFRGNVDTRLEKLQNGVADATFLAYAGLKRLGKEHLATEVFDHEYMIPAAGQGAIGLECRRADSDIISWLKEFNHMPSYQCIHAERAVLEGVIGKCHTPIGVYAEIQNHQIILSCLAIPPDGQQMYHKTMTEPWPNILKSAQRVGEELRTWYIANAPQALC